MPDLSTNRITTQWADTRRSLLLELVALPGEGDVLQWQRRLADALIDAEHPPTTVRKAEAQRHRHLLRVIADGLVHALLPEHTIRSLSRHPGRPASLSAQGVDFDFVFEQASELLRRGFIPIIADLTTLIGIGDLVGWNADEVIVLECKNRSLPARQPTTGRLARQRLRGEQVETFLTTSHIQEDNVVRQAVAFSLPSPDWNEVEVLIDSCTQSPSGTATYELGPADMLIASTSQSSPESFMDVVPEDYRSLTMALAFYSELIDTASHRLMAPSSYPIRGTDRLRLLEGELRLTRLADLSNLAAEFDHDGYTISLVPEHSAGRLTLRVDVGGQHYTAFTHELAEFCLWMPVPVRTLRQTLIDYTRTLLDERDSDVELGASASLAPGDNFTYMTAYRSN